MYYTLVLRFSSQQLYTEEKDTRTNNKKYRSYLFLYLATFLKPTVASFQIVVNCIYHILIFLNF